MTGLSTLFSHVCRCVRLGRRTCTTPNLGSQATRGEKLDLSHSFVFYLPKFEAGRAARPGVPCHTKSVQRWHLCAGLRRSARTGGGRPVPLVRRVVLLRAWAEAGPVPRLRRVVGLPTRATAGSVSRLRRRVEHARLRHQCRQCGGASICAHGRLRHQCRECERGRLRPQCRDCGGTAVCEHGRRRQQCSECGGATICQHRRQRAHCCDCSNFVCPILGCPRQDLPFSGAQSLLGHMRTMRGDNPRAVTKSKELAATRRSPTSTSTTCPSAAAGWGRRRPTPSRTLPCRLRGATSCWRFTRSSARSTTPAATCAGTSTWPPAWRSAAATSCWCRATTRTPSRSPAWRGGPARRSATRS